MPPLRIVFIGTAAFAVPSLRALIEAGHEVPLVVTQPDRPGHRLQVTPPPVKVAAQELGRELFQPARLRAPESVARLTDMHADLHVVAAYGQILSGEVLSSARRGVLNVHASLLPRWRGAAPVAHAILAGDERTGVTIMQMDEQLDHGPVLATRVTEIAPRETAGALTERLAVLGAQLLVETLANLDRVTPREQDHSLATKAGKLDRSHGELEWTLDGLEIDRRVRALDPWPGVTLPLAGRRLKVLRGHVGEGAGEPGRVLRVCHDGVEVAARRGSYVLELVQAPGRRPVSPATILHPHGS